MRVDHVRIYSDWMQVIINGQENTPFEIEALAKKDGFPDKQEFFKFFNKSGDEFEGQIIWWRKETCKKATE